MHLPQTATTASQELDQQELYDNHVNPQWVRLLNLLRMNVQYDRCQGAELFAADGRVVLDYLSGYCVHNAGHNHPRIIQALKHELDRQGPAMLQSHVPDLAGELAEKLCTRAGGRVNKAFFCSSGSEGVEAAIKFARAHTGRTGMLFAEGAFHGLTCGALSLMGDPFWKESFGPMLPGTEAVPWGDLPTLERKLAGKQIAALFLEPLQSESGIRIAAPGYLEGAQALCRKYGTLFVLDEVQTGMYRTGRFLAAHYSLVQPDMIVMAKALSGGLVPVGALLMSDAVYTSVFTSLKRSIIHTSTYSENALSMRAGLATLEVLESENLGDRALVMGKYLRARIKDALEPYEMFREVRGLGLLSGIEFIAPKKLALQLPFRAFMAIHPSMFGQVVVMRLYRDGGILSQICGNNFLVLKAAPPLVVTEAQIDHYVDALRNVVDLMHTSGSFWTDALGLARRAVNV